MRQGVLIFIGSLLTSLTAYYLSPLRQFYDITITNALIVAAIGAAVLLAGLFISYLLDRHSSFTAERGSRTLFSRRVLIVLVTLLISELAVLQLLAPTVRSFLLVESAYYLVLFAGGVALARWCSSRSYVAPLVAVAVLAIFATWSFIGFVTSQDATFRYGPERWLFALQNLSGQLTMLPLDVAVALTAWHLFSRRRSPAA